MLRARSTARRAVLPAASAVARCCHALSDETRLSILERLAGGEQCVCNLTGLLEAGQSRLSFHLKVLRDAGLVSARRDGRWMHYSLDPRGLDVVRGFVNAIDPSRRKK